MRLHITITTFLIALLAQWASAVPTGIQRATYHQPDGTAFNVTITGDEWNKSRKTEEGCAIVRDEDGWWCYAVYDAEGYISSTGYRIGQPAPMEILSESRNIPYRILSQKARHKRNIVSRNSPRRLESIRKLTSATKAGNSKTQHRGLALLVQFTDTKFRYKKEDFENLLNQKGFKGTGSAKDYYEYQFGENWEFTFDVSEIITLPYAAEHYGRNDQSGHDIRVEEMVKEACKKADETIDFSLYDLDNDGFVDNVYLFYAGESEAENTEDTDLIWPHLYYIYSGDAKIYLKLDGKQIDMYACSSELTDGRSLTGIGPFCHEFGHSLGLADLYDTDYDEDGGWAAGTWRTTSIMDGGNYNNNSATPPNLNCIEREMLGISTATILEKGESYTLAPIQENSTIFRLDTDTPGEYYLLECRNNQGWDKYIGGKGMLVYHIDRNYTITYDEYTRDAWYWNAVNAISTHQCADLIEADGRSDMINSNSDLHTDISGIFFPRNDVTALGTDSAPALKYWNGNSSNLAIIGIKTSGDNISFTAQDKAQVLDVPGVTNTRFTAFPDAVILTFDSTDHTQTGAEAVVEWRKNGTSDALTAATAIDCSNGRYACKIEGLSGNVSYELYIRFELGGACGPTYRLPFQTKRKPTVEWPYIYITDSDIQQETGLALHIVNASDAAEIEWQYNGSKITPDKDFFFRPNKSGTLKAIIKWEDGSTDTIIKTLNVDSE